jgi:hypothetical protein
MMRRQRAVAVGAASSAPSCMNESTSHVPSTPAGAGFARAGTITEKLDAMTPPMRAYGGVGWHCEFSDGPIQLFTAGSAG